ncbi:GATA type zinc finger transcription factor family protein [Actinidia rufa]|uniref:GATA type zinc finger transcription factor family protein n=1 Tax=Actinidia rufa TaxID=165716 RepID=A0A7J0DNA0_9ERIC|nr:GATA type zinc finger transcription factor family protein [Actinidia rufa]
MVSRWDRAHAVFSTHQVNSFSMLFSVPNHKPIDEADVYSSSFTASSSVDCTLSLGTPSTRLTAGGDAEQRVPHERRLSSWWDLLQSKHMAALPLAQKAGHGSNGNCGNSTGGDPLFSRRCANCDTTSTPLWRNGPRGPKSLCNACGIRFKKEERRATATATAATSTTTGAASGLMDDPQHMPNNSWLHHHSQPPKLPCLSPAIGNEFRFINEDNRDATSNIPFHSWHLNVTDRPGLVHDFTR